MSDSSDPAVVLSNVYDLYVTVRAPVKDSVQANHLERWMNLQHTGGEKLSQEPEPNGVHARAVRRMGVDHLCPIRLELQPDGSYVPVSLQIGGKTYAMTPIPDPPAPEPSKPGPFRASCRKCNGAGTIRFQSSFSNPPSPNDWDEESCSACDGTGTVPT